MKTFLVIILVLVLGGCSLNNQEMNSGIEKCVNNNGVKYFFLELGTTEVMCNNGAKFTIHSTPLGTPMINIETNRKN